jgi:DNA-binding Lrp family transcriptional regulator
MNAPSDADLAIAKALEEGIPLEERPFCAIAESLDLCEDELLERVRRLVDCGAIRRLAVIFNSRALSFATTLVAAKPVDGRFCEAAALVNSYDEVTHNYRRAGSAFEMWFTLTADGRERIGEILGEFSASGLFDRVMELPAERVFKTRVSFARAAEASDE